MTKYAVDKVLWQVSRDPAAEERFKHDRAGFLAGRELNGAEHAALLGWDVRTLFVNGAHPFLIYMASIKVSGGWSFQFMSDYVKALEGLSLVDITT